MNVADRTHLMAEKAFLQSRLAELPEDALLTRMSTASKLRSVDQELARLPEREPARLKLTFNGRPVIRSHGIFADFSMKAVNAFTEAVAAVAASLTAPLALMGPIPNRDQHQMLITSTAVGSFGFELEEHGNGQLPMEEQSAVQQAIKRTQSLLYGAIASDDEQLADAATDLGRRALDKVRTFVVTLADNEAVCSLQYGSQTFRFSSVGQVREALERLSTDNLVEDERQLQGHFEGALPHRRTFEFKLADSEEIIVGKIAHSIHDPAKINDHLRERITVSMMETRVGNGRPRYQLLTLPWHEDS